ncbi:MAG: DUF2290 domain-containing protein [Clostridiales bacterium]|nr:DUF2290 domain-containing protein [Clostridiales bacterium]
MKKQQNLYVERIEKQINVTLDALNSKELLYTYNKIYKKSRDSNKCFLSWNNHKKGKFNTNKYFLKVEQYKKILENNSYLCIFYDGSLVRVSYSFENDYLVNQTLLWWPAPYFYEGITVEDMSPLNLMEEFLADSQWCEVLRIRSPVRVDFDPLESAVSRLHSPTHMHMQNEECRLYVKNPLCFIKFIEFVLKNFYPEKQFRIDPRDYIDFQTLNSFENYEFGSSQIIV